MSDWDDGYAKGRADERARDSTLTVAWMDRYNAQVEAERQALANLYAKVEVLPGKPNGKNWIRRDQVLDLIDGSGDEPG